MLPTIGVAIASIPPRQPDLLVRALASVDSQYYLPVDIQVATDELGVGARETKNTAVSMLRNVCEYVAILDDDDEFLPHHLMMHAAMARYHDADVVYAIPTVPAYDGDHDRNHDQYNKPFDSMALKTRPFIPTTSLIRRSLFEMVGGFQPVDPQLLLRDSPANSTNSEWLDYDDWGLYLRLYFMGAKFVHLPVQTWVWHVNDDFPGRPGTGNTSGKSDRWLG